MDDLTTRGILALKAGDCERAYTLLNQAVLLDPLNETAWLWMSGAAEEVAEQLRCLKWVLALNPENKQAKQGVAMLAPHRFAEA